MASPIAIPPTRNGAASLARPGPEASGLISYNADGRWGLQVSGDFSDTTVGTAGGANAGANATEGLDQYGVIFHGENGYSAAAYNGFLGAWNGAPIPSRDHAESRTAASM